MNKGLNRSQQRLLCAFRELLTQQEYYEITVAEIISEANVGKTTFYRHYERKLDLFIEMHKEIFDIMLQELSSRDDWLSLEPRPMLIEMVMKAVGKTGGRVSIAYKLGNDWPHAQRLLNKTLAAAINARLSVAFSDQEWAMSKEQLSSALAALYIDFLIQLNGAPYAKDAEVSARNLQSFSRALVLAALCEHSLERH